MYPDTNAPPHFFGGRVDMCLFLVVWGISYLTSEMSVFMCTPTNDPVNGRLKKTNDKKTMDGKGLIKKTSRACAVKNCVGFKTRRRDNTKNQ